MTVGRKRKPGKRYPCGKLIRKETEIGAMSTAIAARQRQFGVGREDARDPRLGSALGRLAFFGRITDAQYRAGLAFAELYRQHHLVMGLPMPTPHSAAALLVNERVLGPGRSEASPQAVELLRHRFAEATNALHPRFGTQRSLPAGRPLLLVYRILFTQADRDALNETEIGEIRAALDALIRLFRL